VAQTYINIPLSAERRQARGGGEERRACVLPWKEASWAILCQAMFADGVGTGKRGKDGLPLLILCAMKNTRALYWQGIELSIRTRTARGRLAWPHGKQRATRNIIAQQAGVTC